MKYGFIRDHAGNYPVTLLCRLLGVQRSPYYEWRAQPCKIIPEEELALRRRMKALFVASRCSLGSRTMMKNLNHEGFEIGRDRTRRLMKRLGLKVRQKRKYKVTKDSNHKLPVAQNILNRDFSPSAPNRAWGTDITYLWTQQGWVYLAVVIDLYSRRVVGWSMDRRMKKALVIRALMMAVNLRKPPVGLIHHSDRGSQYCSIDYQAVLRKHGLLISMSGKGNCYDNAVVETFFKTIKSELIWPVAWQTRSQAENAVARYIDGFYNPIRRHSTLGYKSPVQFEMAGRE